jgi:soluble lytic murein transglycosylase-like protein
MKLTGWIFLTAAAFALLLPAAADAEIVLLTSGRTLSVKSHRIDGDNIVLKMRDGGEVTCDRSLIEKIVPDEIPYVEPASPAPEPEPAVAPAAPTLPDGPYSELITAMAQAHGVNPMLVQALIQVESNYRPTARSHKGAMGLMQLMPSTARQYKVRNPYDPKANVAAGVKHLKSLLDRLGAVDLALAAYNAGEGAVKKFNGIPPYRETRTYVSRILSLAGIQ